MVANETLKYIDALPHIIFAYNECYHRSINLSPKEAKKDENFQKLLLLNLKKFHKLKKVKLKPKFSVGQIVRVSIDKSKVLSSRSYNLQNSYPKYEIYKISLHNSVHAKYFLKHVASDKKIESGYFYDWQLTPCTNPAFRGNVIKTRKRRGRTEYLFRFKGIEIHS